MSCLSLAIELSSPHGSIAIGRGDDLLTCVDVAQSRRHNLDLMPTIAAAFDQLGLSVADLGETYVSIGPGSFTGLRIAVATAKMLAMTRGVRLIGVPGLDVLVHNAPPDVRHVAPCLNLKRQSMWCAVYRLWGESWQIELEPALRSFDELLAAAPHPVALLGDPLPEAPTTDGVTMLPAALATPRADVLWRLGRSLAQRQRFDDPAMLWPLYAREPEAVTLWEARSAGTQER